MSRNDVRAVRWVVAFLGGQTQAIAGPALLRHRVVECWRFERASRTLAHGARGCFGRSHWLGLVLMIIVVVVSIRAVHFLHLVENLHRPFHQFFKFVLSLFIEEACLLLQRELLGLAGCGTSPGVLLLWLHDLAPLGRWRGLQPLLPRQWLDFPSRLKCLRPLGGLTEGNVTFGNGWWQVKRFFVRLLREWDLVRKIDPFLSMLSKLELHHAAATAAVLRLGTSRPSFLTLADALPQLLKLV